jgi:D-alanyl-D-alanine carboxypeptidase
VPTAGPIVACAERKPAADDLYVVVTDGFGLSAKYIPPDLVRLDKYLPYSVVYAETVKVRQIAVDGLVKMIKAMQAAGLKPIVRSAYRSYYDQLAAYTKWEKQNPGRVGYLSALPGHSEHQLGLAVDFGSPELAEIVGDPSIEFHSDFDRTREGRWLGEHAQEYGFALSYPPNATTWTSLTYEPWHYRYVGVEMATYLYASSQFLTQYVMEQRPTLPCMPGK